MYFMTLNFQIFDNSIDLFEYFFFSSTSAVGVALRLLQIGFCRMNGFLYKRMSNFTPTKCIKNLKSYPPVYSIFQYLDYPAVHYCCK